MARPKKNAAQAQDTLLTLDTVPEIPVEEQPYPLPEGWKWVRLGSLCSLRNGKAFKPTDWSESGLPIVRIQNLNSPNNKFNYYDGIIEDKFLINSGDLLFAWSGTPGTSFGAHIWKGGKALLNQHIFRVDFEKKIILKIFFKYAINYRLNEFIVKAHGGAGLQHITKRNFENTSIPLPPLEVQQRIVERIETLFAKLDEAREKAESVLESFELRKAAILHKAFTGELTAKWRKEKGIQLNWEEKQLADIGSIVTGSTPSTKHHEYYGDAIPFIKPADLNSGRFVNQASEYLSKEGGKISRSVRAGSTCVCCIGTIGKCGFLTCDATTNQQINTICPYNFMDDLFVYYYCTSIKFKEMLINSSYSTTISIINKSKMSILPIPVPHLSEQQKIVRILDRIFAREQQAREAAENVLQRIDQMKKAILARAFRGELG
ncbi:restriction endonuclease subunit S [Desulfovibrio sp. SGI.133]|uniref:restriction endonuclease subunit S n=1 Tax=Desulfovibrio sp. SGI.133 TaxID=3420560 RepID=UPI003CFD4BBA